MVDQNAGTNNTLLNEVLVHCSIFKKIADYVHLFGLVLFFYNMGWIDNICFLGIYNVEYNAKIRKRENIYITNNCI